MKLPEAYGWQLLFLLPAQIQLLQSNHYTKYSIFHIVFTQTQYSINRIQYILSIRYTKSNCCTSMIVWSKHGKQSRLAHLKSQTTKKIPLVSVAGETSKACSRGLLFSMYHLKTVQLNYNNRSSDVVIEDTLGRWVFRHRISSHNEKCRALKVDHVRKFSAPSSSCLPTTF